MKPIVPTLFLIIWIFAAGSAFAADAALAKPLEPLAPLLGKTWKGTFKESTPEKPMHDVARWERALNGQAVRVLHSVNDGAYGGESLVIWDAAKNSLMFYYFTTAGFYTTGTLTVEGQRFISRETVTGNTQGITEVESVNELLPDGRMRVTARYLKKGEWVGGREVVYVEDPAAQVIFK
jgi:hypothetical protein